MGHFSDTILTIRKKMSIINLFLGKKIKISTTSSIGRATDS